jgi:superoxide dismutase, Fe-Mn family
MTTRRELMTGTAAALAVATAARAEAPLPALAKGGAHGVVPLSFDPKKLKGLSDKLIASHHENNYAGAVKNLNKVEGELASVTKDTPGFVVSGLKERELLFTNSMVLHELYFGNLGGDGKPAGDVSKALPATWETDLRATAMSLAGGSGWAILDLNLHTGALRTYWSGTHSQAAALGAPLLVLDMYEHAYALDYGAAAAKYVDAFMANVRWDVVDARYARAQKALAALRA